MSSNGAYEALQAAILDGDTDKATELGKAMIQDPASLPKALETAIGTIRVVGDRFGTGEIYLPEMVLAADAMLAFMGIIGPYLKDAAGGPKVTGKVVLGTVKGDIHSIGKDLVATMLKASGFEVIDMGVNVSPMDMIKTADQTGAKVIALSALMTTSMPYQREVVELMKAMERRKDFWIIVGGGPVTVDYAQQISANGWAASAAGAARLCERLLSGHGDPAAAEFAIERN
jgi:trimethylamine corrinoid protein